MSRAETSHRKAVHVSFVIPVKDDAVRLARCLASIAANKPTAKIEVIVTDNGSEDGSQDVARAAGAHVLSLPALRVSELRNRGAEAASGEVVAFVDADHEIGPQWVESAIDALGALDVGAAGALYTAPEDSWVQRSYGALRGTTVGQRDVGWLGSGNLAVRRAAFESVGGFDESLEACEDVDLCQRMRKAGWRVVGDERLRSVHMGDPPTLAALFRAERWRGRDNLRVTLRGSLTARDLPSVAIPVVQAASAVTLIACLAALPVFGTRMMPLVMAALFAIIAPSAMRAARAAINAGRRRPLELLQGAVVALIYDLARACALFSRAPHHRRTDPSVRIPRTT